MRFLYLDDSGKTDPRHPSNFVVYAGLSLDESEWTPLHRRITGAKAKYFPLRVVFAFFDNAARVTPARSLPYVGAEWRGRHQLARAA